MKQTTLPFIKTFAAVLVCLFLQVIPFSAIHAQRLQEEVRKEDVLSSWKTLSGQRDEDDGKSYVRARQARPGVAGQRLEVIDEEKPGVPCREKSLPEEIKPEPGAVIPLVFNDAVLHHIALFTTTGKEHFKTSLKRQSRYEPLVRQILRERGLPEDLVYLAMIESGFNVKALSPMNAAGPWQFIPATGRRYGLTVNEWIDERLDIQKSTVAAADYLTELFNQFDCWHLAAAAYNAGENRVDRVVRRFDTRDFWQLRTYKRLPRETREYVPQIVAAAIVAKNPERYRIGQVDPDAPFEFVTGDVPGGVSLSTVAKAASTDLSAVRTLNPQLRRGVTPPGKECRIKLPADTDADTFQSSLASILQRGIFSRKESKRASLRRPGGVRTASHLNKTSPRSIRKYRLGR